MTNEVIQTILAAIPLIEAESKRLDGTYGIENTTGSDPFDERSVQRAFAQNIHEQELETRLLDFDEEPLLQAEALMYYGRDNNQGTFHEKLEYLGQRGDSKQEIVRTLIEKIPAAGKYFHAAKLKLQKGGFSVDEI